MEYDQRYNQALGYMLDLYTDNHITDSVTVEQFKELFDMFIDSKKDIDTILYPNNIVELSNDITINQVELYNKHLQLIEDDIYNSMRVTLSNM
ncbi:hypothetical protein EXM36_17125 [Clostridium botulinum]|nr:hypothetical protein [Clostridium botulinum]NFA39639.1 hypothetical protein [Clostridium botulinum]NFA75500.1 hypothetical protein [Clostridium botulinum]NFB50908.1 hypothetical protein [Clostridium botulinum]NFD15737.1 hypothetical protein [Clostridium botulinum]